MKKKLLSLLSTGALIIGMTGIANATAFSIDFDSLPDGSAITTGTILTDQYQDWGVIFDGNLVLSLSTYATSGTNVLRPDTGYQGSYTVSFLDTVDYVGFTGIDIGENGLSLTGYDNNNNQIAYNEVFGTGYGIGQNFDLSLYEQNISYIEISQVQNVTGDGYVIDDLLFNTADPVPEPATMLLFGAGLAGLVGYSRKRSKKS